MVKNAGLLVLLLALAVMLPTLSYAQFGEVAGPLQYSIPVGGQQSLTVTIVNQASVPAQYRVILPTLNIIPNTTTPTMSAYPMNGTVPAQSHITINVTTYVPYANNKPNLNWNGILQILLVANSTGSGGGGASAAIQAGLAKIVSISTLPPIFNPLPYEVAGIVIVVAAVLRSLLLSEDKEACGVPREARSPPRGRSLPHSPEDHRECTCQGHPCRGEEGRQGQGEEAHDEEGRQVHAQEEYQHRTPQEKGVISLR